MNQLQRWNQVFARNMKWLEPLYGERKAKNLAAAIAWKDAKAHGAKTKLEVFGNRQVEILHDTGVLFNSLSPGVVTGTGADASYIPATNQIAEDRPGKLIVGTTVKYAAAHQNPKRKGGVQRKILPDPASVPDSWLRYFADTATSGFVAAIHMIARGGK